MIITQTTINLSSQLAPPIIQAVQGDTGRNICFKLADFTIPAGAAATYYIQKPSGEAIYNSATISGNEITCELTAQSLAEIGENPMQVRISADGEIVTSFDAILLVRPFRGIGAIESGTEINIFDQAVEKAAEDFQEQAEEIVQQVIESIPADYTELTEEVSELNERLGEVNNRLDENPLTSIQSIPFEVSYPWQSGDPRFNTAARCFWSEIVPADATITEVYTYIANVGGDPYITFEIWELNNDRLTLATSKTFTDIASNSNIVCSFNHYSDKPRMICFRSANIQSRSYRTGQTGYSWKYTTDVSEETTSLTLSGLTTFSSMKLIGGFKYTVSNPVKRDFFSGILDGNIIVFGDSTVDGSSVTGHADNTIGTDRTATDEPNVYTSIVENMINTFTGGSKRVYNAGFGGKTLNYIADNYTNIMNAFSNVKSAILVIDANSASGTRAEYEEGIRSGLTRMFELLKTDGISFAVMSPQPMFFYPADDGTLPAINSAGEYYMGVNIGKDLCIQYNVPFIDLGNKTNYMMDSPYLNSQYFLGDRIHFGDNGHKVEAYELYGELIHPILYFEGNETYIGLQSNKGELSSTSGISATFVGGYQSIVLQATNTRTDVLHRIYVLSRIPFTIKGITISGWTAYYDVLVDGETYTSNTVEKGGTIPAGWHEITVKPTATEHIVRYSGLVFEKV